MRCGSGWIRSACRRRVRGGRVRCLWILGLVVVCGGVSGWSWRRGGWMRGFFCGVGVSGLKSIYVIFGCDIYLGFLHVLSARIEAIAVSCSSSCGSGDARGWRADWFMLEAGVPMCSGQRECKIGRRDEMRRCDDVVVVYTARDHVSPALDHSPTSTNVATTRSPTR